MRLFISVILNIIISINHAYSIEKPINRDIVEELMKPVLPKNIVGHWVTSGGNNENTVKSFFIVKIYGILEVFNYQNEECYKRSSYRIIPLENNKYQILYQKPIEVSLFIEKGKLRKTFIYSYIDDVEFNEIYPRLKLSKRTSFKICQGTDKREPL